MSEGENPNAESGSETPTPVAPDAPMGGKVSALEVRHLTRQMELVMAVDYMNRFTHIPIGHAKTATRVASHVLASSQLMKVITNKDIRHLLLAFTQTLGAAHAGFQSAEAMMRLIAHMSTDAGLAAEVDKEPVKGAAPTSINMTGL